MTPEAQAILDVFRLRGVHVGEFVEFTDFGEAMVWEAGFVRDAEARDAIGWLQDNGYVVELGLGLELTALGDEYLYVPPQPKHGARVYGLGDVVLIKQTVLRGNPPEYVIDEQRERHVSLDDDTGIADAIRAAVRGEM